MLFELCGFTNFLFQQACGEAVQRVGRANLSQSCLGTSGGPSPPSKLVLNSTSQQRALWWVSMESHITPKPCKNRNNKGPLSHYPFMGHSDSPWLYLWQRNHRYPLAFTRSLVGLQPTSSEWMWEQHCCRLSSSCKHQTQFCIWPWALLINFSDTINDFEFFMKIIIRIEKIILI